MNRFYAAALIILLLSACGLKGPLYLPQESQPTQDKEKKR
ncbi:MAG TPA: lipoprotein [Nitrosospira sp.]|jgi:predicted small lipoprotein YifL|nr:lipoprotein [Nitrosospira sp.]